MSDNMLNVPKSNMSSFYDDLEARLALLTGIVSMEDLGLTLEQVRKPMLVVGLPGIGKTAGIMSIIKNLNETKLKGTGRELGFKKILLGQTVVGSMSGIPVVMNDGTVKRVQVPDLPDPNRDPEYGVLFLDEITTADEAQVQPALGLCDDSRNIGEYTLPPHWLVISAGNGPDCSNFLRLDDMTISRFVVYDIAYDFVSDWRPYANANGIEDDIIAFLNFSPTSCVRVESDENDVSGRLFPCPRTWERLSNELKIRRAVGKPVPQQQMADFAGRIVGLKAGREFQSFTAFHEKVTYDPRKIVEGTERAPELDMEKQVYFIILQNCMKLLKTKLNQFDDGSSPENFPPEAKTAVANVLRWFLCMEQVDLESTFSALLSLRGDDERIRGIVQSRDFDDYCPELMAFTERNWEALIETKRAGAYDMSF